MGQIRRTLPLKSTSLLGYRRYNSKPVKTNGWKMFTLMIADPTRRGPKSATVTTAAGSVAKALCIKVEKGILRTSE